MNKYLRAMVVMPFGAIKMGWIKLFHPKNFRGTIFCMLSPSSEISMNYGAQLTVNKGLRMRDNAKLRVRSKATCVLGASVSLGSGSMIVCHEKIKIGSRVQFAANAQVYDHDHDFRAKGGISARKFKTSPIEIGDDVWIGANTVILRGTRIGDRCVIGAGCVLKGEYPSDSVIVQKRETTVTSYKMLE